MFAEKTNVEENKTGLRLKSGVECDPRLKIRDSESGETEDIRCDISFNAGAGSWRHDCDLQCGERRRIAAASFCTT